LARMKAAEIIHDHLRSPLWFFPVYLAFPERASYTLLRAVSA
jgi:hypothetical protein